MQARTWEGWIVWCNLKNETDCYSIVNYAAYLRKQTRYNPTRGGMSTPSHSLRTGPEIPSSGTEEINRI
jgi:hypothetical protein